MYRGERGEKPLRSKEAFKGSPTLPPKAQTTILFFPPSSSSSSPRRFCFKGNLGKVRGKYT